MLDKSRAKIEEMPPHEYLTKTYYQKWAQRLEQLLIEYGYIGEDEVKAGRSLRPGKPLPRFLPAAEVNKALSRGTLFARADRPGALQGRRPRAHAGTSIRTRTPGCRATRATRSAWSNACAASTCSRIRSRSARARTRNGSTRCCSTARELWGEAADPKSKVSIEAWDPYLEPA